LAKIFGEGTPTIASSGTLLRKSDLSEIYTNSDDQTSLFFIYPSTVISITRFSLFPFSSFGLFWE
jgi:hypothetical protein